MTHHDYIMYIIHRCGESTKVSAKQWRAPKAVGSKQFCHEISRALKWPVSTPVLGDYYFTLKIRDFATKKINFFTLLKQF